MVHPLVESCRGKRFLLLLYSRKNGGKPFFPFAVVQKRPFLTEIGRNSRTSFSSEGESVLLEEDTAEQFQHCLLGPLHSPYLTQFL